MYPYDYLYPHLQYYYLLLFYLNQEGRLRSTLNKTSSSFAKARASMTLFNMFGSSSSWGIGLTKPRSVSNNPSWMSALFQNERSITFVDNLIIIEERTFITSTKTFFLLLVLIVAFISELTGCWSTIVANLGSFLLDIALNKLFYTIASQKVLWRK